MDLKCEKMKSFKTLLHSRLQKYFTIEFIVFIVQEFLKSGQGQEQVSAATIHWSHAGKFLTVSSQFKKYLEKVVIMLY